jgi:DNA-binding response OmpR family regulator
VRKRQIVVVEDEDLIRRGIADALTATGYVVREAVDGPSGLAEARRHGVDLVLLDLLLPGMDGLDVLTELRQTHKQLPVIILTARGSEEDRVRGLRRGADDYVVKPFSARELLARVEAVLRRSGGPPAAIRRLVGPGAAVDFPRREVCFEDDSRRALTEMEAGVLAHLAGNEGRAISREELLAHVWGISSESLETRAIDMQVTRLRSKLGDRDSERGHDWIVTVRGQGYMLGPDVQTERASPEEEPA